MKSFFLKPAVQKALLYFLAYLLFALFAFLGVLVTINLHGLIIDICGLLNARASVAYFFHVWGAFLLFCVYIVMIAIIEPYLHNAVKNGQVLKRALRVFAFEGSLALITLVAPLITGYLRAHL